MNRIKLANFLKTEKGQSLVETAIVAPILLLMFLGVIEVGWALRNYVALQNANREAARFAARGRYLDFSQVTVDSVGYPYVVQHELDSLAGQVPLDLNTGTANGTVIVSHLLVDTGAVTVDHKGDCEFSTEDDLILTPVTPGYGYFQATFGEARPSQVDFGALGEQLRAQNEQFNCDLQQRDPGALPSVNSAIVVETYYAHPLLVGTPILTVFLPDNGGKLWLYTKTVMRITSDSRGQVPSAGQGCEAYPIAVHTSTLAGMQPGDSTGDIFNGGGPGNFGWLAWNDWPGHISQSYLVEEFQNPRLSHNTFVDASDPTDTTLNAGDWVWGLTGVVNSNDVRDELQKLVDSGATIRIPVWDTAQGVGGNLSYHIDRFVLVRLTDFGLPDKRIRATFVGEDPNACLDVAPAGPPTNTPTVTATLDPSAPTPTTTDTPTATSTPTATATATQVAPSECDNPLPPAGSPWDSADVGSITSAGYTGAGGGDVYICGTGGVIWGSTDTFRYAYQVVSSPNVEIIARLREWGASPAAGDYAQTGVMIRNSTSPGAAHGFLVTNESYGTFMDWRPSDGSNTQETSDGGYNVPLWFKVVKIGNTISTFRSADGSNWTPVGGGQTVTLGSTYLVGFAVSSDHANHYAHAIYDSISINTSITAPTPTATATEPAGPVNIASDDFESGGWNGGSGWTGGYSHSGTADVTTSGGAHDGSFHLRLRSDDALVTRQVNMSGVTNARLQFYWKAASFERGEHAYVGVYDGSWHTVLTIDNGEDDGNYHYADIDISSYTMGSNFQIAFQSDMSGNGDYFYIDDLVVVGNR